MGWDRLCKWFTPNHWATRNNDCMRFRLNLLSAISNYVLKMKFPEKELRLKMEFDECFSPLRKTDASTIHLTVFHYLYGRKLRSDILPSQTFLYIHRRNGSISFPIKRWTGALAFKTICLRNRLNDRFSEIATYLFFLFEIATHRLFFRNRSFFRNRLIDRFFSKIDWSITFSFWSFRRLSGRVHRHAGTGAVDRSPPARAVLPGRDVPLLAAHGCRQAAVPQGGRNQTAAREFARS